MKSGLISCVAVSLLVAVAQGAVINVPCDTSDTSVSVDDTGTPKVMWTGQSSLTVGDDNYKYSKGDGCAVVVFALPDLGGEAISTANLGFDLYTGYPGGVNDWPKSVDLYAVRYASSNAVLVSDYAGIGAAPLGNGDLLQQGIFIMPSSGVYAWDAYETDATGDAALAAWLSAQYAAGAQAGDFVFLRFNLDKPTANPVNVASANNTEHNAPVLTIETIPEPTSMILLGLGAVAMIRRRR